MRAGFYTPTNAAAISFVADDGRWDDATIADRFATKNPEAFRNSFLLGAANATTFARLPSIDFPFFVYDRIKRERGRKCATLYMTTLIVRLLEISTTGATSNDLADYSGGFRDTVYGVLNALDASREYALIKIRWRDEKRYRIERTNCVGD